jgi:hypothetical protein
MPLALIPIINFFRSPMGRYLLIALAVIVLLFTVRQCGVSAGVTQERARDAALEKSAKANVAKHEVKAAAISTTAKADLVKTQTVIQTRTITLLKEVPTYVTAKDDAACTVPPGFVGLWNRGESGEAGLAGRPGGYDSALAVVQPAAAQP